MGCLSWVTQRKWLRCIESALYWSICFQGGFVESDGGLGRLGGHDLEVPCFPIHTILLALNVTHVDYFSLDVEGFELQVIRTIPWNLVRYKCHKVLLTCAPFYSHRLTIIPATVRNHISSRVWDEIAYPFPNFNCTTVEKSIMDK